MPKLSLIIATVACASTLSALAQGLYRSVGPDGKVTYSDQPPTPSEQSKTTVLRKAERPSETPAPAAGSSQARTAAPSSAATDGSALEAAIVGVLGNEAIVRHIDGRCHAVLSLEFTRYRCGGNEWRYRNAAAISSARAARERLDPEARRKVELSIDARVGDLGLHRISNARRESAYRWCDRECRKIEKGELDVAQRPEFTAPLAATQRR